MDNNRKMELENKREKLLTSCIEVLQNPAGNVCESQLACPFSLYVSQNLTCFPKRQRVLAEKRSSI